MTLTYELDPDILKMYMHVKNKVSRSRLSKVRAQTEQNRQMRPSTLSAAFAGGNK